MSQAIRTLVPPGGTQVLGGQPASGRLAPGAAPGAVQIAGIAGVYSGRCEFVKGDGSACKSGAALGTELCYGHLKRTGREKSARLEWEQTQAAREANVEHAKFEKLAALPKLHEALA